MEETKMRLKCFVSKYELTEKKVFFRWFTRISLLNPQFSHCPYHTLKN